MAWLPGYTYRKKKPINSTTAGVQTDYQKKLLVGESSGATGEEIDCEGHCHDFPDDIRFAAANGTTKYNYWMESITGTTPNRLATMQIKVASIPASGDIDLWMYYGKSEDSDESSGANTFVFFTGNPKSLGFTQTQALSVSQKAWQGVASDGTNIYTFTNCEGGSNNVQKIYKLNKSGVQQDVNSAAGTDHMSDGCYYNSKLYVADMKSWYDGQLHSEAVGNIRLYNITSGLPYASENHDVGSHWAEGICYYNSHFWIVFHCCSIIRKYDTSWNFVKEYDIAGHGATEESWANGNGYQGIDFFQDGAKTYVGLTVHHNVTGGPEFYYFEYNPIADSFILANHVDPPNTAANQGWQCDDSLDISDVWFADREGPPGYVRQDAGSFAYTSTGNWEEYVGRGCGTIAIMDTPQKRTSSKAFRYTQDTTGTHGLWRDSFLEQNGEFFVEWDIRIPANNKKHILLITNDQLSWDGSKHGPDIVINRDGTHEGWISIYTTSGYEDIQTFTINQWYKFGLLIRLGDDDYDFYIDDTEKVTNRAFYIGNTLTDLAQISIGGYKEYQYGYYYVQDVRLRKHATPEPTWGTSGGEETPARSHGYIF